MNNKCWSLTVVAVLAACGPNPESSDEPVADASGAAVEFELISAMEGEGHFRLSNPTSQPIVFSSTHESAAGAHAEDARLKCKAADSDQWDEGPRPMGDSPVTTLEVPPGSQQTVVVLWEPGLLQHYAACRVDLRLEDGTVVESGEFSR